MGKRNLSEEDIKHRFITPAIEKAGWEKKQVRMEYAFTDGKITVRGNIVNRGKRKKVDYLLFYKANFPLAIIEAKSNKFSVGEGLQQAIAYAKALDVYYVYASNGDGFVEQNLITGDIKNLSLDEFPSPEELHKRCVLDMHVTPLEEKVNKTPYYYIQNYKKPRYYQRIGINRTVDAVAKGQKKILLVCATGTGKTFMAFQIIYRLWKAGLKKKILFLADRNILIDQTMSGDFKPLSKNMTKIKNRTLDSAYEVYLGLYQQLVSEDGKDDPYKKFKPEFFDLIVVDECHRGSAKETSAWRKILDYFSSATQIGCTATPVETKEASSQLYFGEPVYEYSLKQGIEDGFLAPYKVIRVGIDKDLEGYRPENGKVDDYGNEVEDREYNVKDYDRKLVLDQRTKVVAKRITEFLKKTDRYSKTIVFCINIEHAERMRQALILENKDLYSQDDRYIMSITSKNQEGKDQLENFIDEESTYPVIAVTSKLMSTGVDAKMCKLIVLDNNINSTTEFKQIIGRGTRIVEDYGKTFFTIMDFRGSTRIFARPEFDGPAEVIIDIKPDEPLESNGEGINVRDDNLNEEQPLNPVLVNPVSNDEEDDDEPRKYYLGDVEVKIINERLQYMDNDGKLITESLTDYTKKNILKKYAKLNDFLTKWSGAQKKQAIIEELKEEGVFLDAVRDKLNKKDLDNFDLICYLAYDQEPLTKQERAKGVKKRNYLNKYSGIARDVISKLLDKYADGGISDIEETKILKLEEFEKIASLKKIMKAFGGKENYKKAVEELENEIYTA